VRVPMYFDVIEVRRIPHDAGEFQGSNRAEWLIAGFGLVDENRERNGDTHLLDFSTAREQRPRDDASEGQMGDVAAHDPILTRRRISRLMLGVRWLGIYILRAAGQSRRERQAGDHEQRCPPDADAVGLVVAKGSASEDPIKGIGANRDRVHEQVHVYPNCVFRHLEAGRKSPPENSVSPDGKRSAQTGQGQSR
jgi:hypothetical protein